MRFLHPMMLAFVFLIFSLSGCAGSLTTLYKPAVIQGVPCQGKVSFHKNGLIRKCRLSHDYSLSGYLLPEGSYIFFKSDGKLELCRLSSETVICGQLFPTGTGIYFSSQRYMTTCFLAHNMIIQGHMCKGHGGIGAMTTFYPNGKLKEVWLGRNEEIQGIPCAANGLFSKHCTTFYDNGNLAQGVLSKNTIIEGHLFKKGELINFNQDGKLIWNEPVVRQPAQQNWQ